MSGAERQAYMILLGCFLGEVFRDPDFFFDRPEVRSFYSNFFSVQDD